MLMEAGTPREVDLRPIAYRAAYLLGFLHEEYDYAARGMAELFARIEGKTLAHAKSWEGKDLLKEALRDGTADRKRRERLARRARTQRRFLGRR
jgi:hypothetical protein